MMEFVTEKLTSDPVHKLGAKRIIYYFGSPNLVFEAVFVIYLSLVIGILEVVTLFGNVWCMLYGSY
jgi:hypothetical protein